MYIKKTIKFKIINFDPNQEIIAIATLNLKTNQIAISAYFAPDTSTELFKNGIETIFNTGRNYNDLIIIGGDFNAKSTTWGNPNTNTKGNIIESAAFENDFILLNNNTPTFSIRDYSTTLDLTYINKNLQNTTWKVFPKITNSNHYPIITNLTDYNTNKPKSTKILHNKILNEITKISIEGNIEDTYKKFQDIIKNNTIQINNNNKLAHRGRFAPSV